MEKIEAAVFRLEDMFKIISFVPMSYCYDCPFYAQEAPWCGWYRKRIENTEKSEFCKIKLITVELWKDNE